MTYAAAGCTASNKVRRNRGQNEDAFEISRMTIADDRSALFLAVFDGHGGCGASHFATVHMREEFEKQLLKQKDVGDALGESFLTIDQKLFSEVRNLADEYKPFKNERCTCNFYRESLCKCMLAERADHEGSTGTVVVFTDGKLYTANIGDSEALLTSRSASIRSKNKLNEEQSFFSSTNILQESLFSPFQKALKSVQTYTEKENRYDESKQKGNGKEVSLMKVLRTRTYSTLLTTAHTPVVGINNEDYMRIKSIAEERYKNRETIKCPRDGIRRGVQSRLNYVSLEGAHSLNMTRAFGNFGHKVFEKCSKDGQQEHVMVEAKSPVIARPDINTYDLNSDQLFLVVASDGLWDNLSKKEVNECVREFCKKQLMKYRSHVARGGNSKNFLGIFDEEEEAKEPDTDAEDEDEMILAYLADGAAVELVSRALAAKKKQDDITVLVVVFTGILQEF